MINEETIKELEGTVSNSLDEILANYELETKETTMAINNVTKLEQILDNERDREFKQKKFEEDNKFNNDKLTFEKDRFEFEKKKYEEDFKAKQEELARQHEENMARINLEKMKTENERKKIEVEEKLREAELTHNRKKDLRDSIMTGIGHGVKIGGTILVTAVTVYMFNAGMQAERIDNMLVPKESSKAQQILMSIFGKI